MWGVALLTHVKNKKYPSVRTVPKSNRNIVETEGKLLALEHIYMIIHFLGLVAELN